MVRKFKKSTRPSCLRSGNRGAGLPLKEQWRMHHIPTSPRQNLRPLCLVQGWAESHLHIRLSPNCCPLEDLRRAGSREMLAKADMICRNGPENRQTSGNCPLDGNGRPKCNRRILTRPVQSKDGRDVEDYPRQDPKRVKRCFALLASGGNGRSRREKERRWQSQTCQEIDWVDSAPNRSSGRKWLRKIFIYNS